MFDENQLVEMQWNRGTKKWYESKGYVFTKMNDYFLVKAKDLKPSSNKVVNVICDYCGKEFTKKYYSLNKSRERGGTDCCSDCRGKKHGESILSKTSKIKFPEIESICKKLGYKLITTIDEYSGVFMDIDYICPKHGRQSTQARILLMGCGCYECGKDKISNALKLSTDYIKSVIEKDGNTWLNPNEYIDVGTTNLKIRCSCGNVYITSYSSYTSYNVVKCPVCSKKESRAETCIKNFLNYHNIDFKQEKSFKECKDINALPFDFYLPKLNICVEFNGLQHYEPVEHFGGYEKFLYQQNHDRIKREYCEQNNIKLICIPYWEEKNIEQILVKELNL